MFEVLNCFKAADVFQEVEVSVSVNACPDESVPMDALKFDVCVILLEGEIECFAEVDVRSFDGVHVIAGHLKLVEVKVLWENFH